MKVPVWVDLGSREIEVALNVEDITAALSQSTDSVYSVRIGLNNIASFLRAIPESIMLELNNEQRKVIHAFLLNNEQRKVIHAFLVEQAESLNHNRAHQGLNKKCK